MKKINLRNTFMISFARRVFLVAAMLLLAGVTHSAEFKTITYYHVDDLGTPIAAANEGVGQTLVSNTIHPFFAVRETHRPVASLKVAFDQGSKSSEPTIYTGSIPNGSWIQAAKLQSGDRLLNADESWSVVTDVQIVSEELKAFNLNVAGFDSFYVRGSDSNSSVGVWVHNCNKNVPKGTPKIKWGQQEKHFPGHNNYTPGPSTMTSNPEKLAQQAGTGQQVGKIPVGKPGSKERVNFGENIGTYLDRAGNSSPTTNGIIHYGKDGIHIVPSRP